MNLLLCGGCGRELMRVCSTRMDSPEMISCEHIRYDDDDDDDDDDDGDDG